jgi:20S proteasome subunit alpha 6
VLKIDDHMGISLAGLTADARTLAKYMRTECLNHKYVYGSNMQARRLAVDLADMHQVHRLHATTSIELCSSS